MGHGSFGKQRLFLSMIILAGMCLLSTHAYAGLTEEVGQGLLAFYSFDRGPASNVLNDSNGPWPQAVVMGTPRWENLEGANKAIAFNGASDFLKISSSTAFFNMKSSEGFSFVARVRADALPRDYQMIIGNWLPYLGVNKAGNVLFSLRAIDGTQKALYSKSKISLSDWTTIGASYSPLDKRARIYINGYEEVVSDPWEIKPEDTRSTFSIAHWSPAVGTSPSTDYLWNGAIDFIRVYNRPLTLRQMMYLHDPAKAQDYVAPTVIATSYQIVAPSWSRYKVAKFETNEEASCRCSQSKDIPFDEMIEIATEPGMYSKNHTLIAKGLTPAKTYNYFVRCQDRMLNTNSSGVRFTFQVQADSTAPNLMDKQVSLLTPEAADVLWTTDEPSTGKVEWGETSAYGQSSRFEESLTLPHACLLQGLKANTVYHYRIRSKDRSGNELVSQDYTFRTKNTQTLLNLYVSLQGSDSNDGSLERPFATLEKARDVLRNKKVSNSIPLGGATVYIRGGVYERTAPFELSSVDSGTTERPIFYKSYQDEKVIIAGTKKVNRWSTTLPEAIKNRLNPLIRDQVIEADLEAAGIPYSLMEAGKTEQYGMQIIFDGRPGRLAEYPNEGFVYVGDVLGGNVNGIDNPYGGSTQFKYEDNRPSNWQRASELWIRGYLCYDWSESYVKVQNIDTAGKVITLSASPTYGLRKNQWYKYINVLEELDSPGEWYIDSVNKKLYFYPPSAMASGKLEISLSPSLLSLSQVSYVTFEGLVLLGAKDNVVSITRGTNVAIANSTIKYAGSCGISSSYTKNLIIYSNDISMTGGRGVQISNNYEQFKQIMPQNSIILNNEIYTVGMWHRTMYSNGGSGIAVAYAVSSHVAHNLIYDSPYIGLRNQGFNNITEFNEIRDVMKEANDGGGIYHGGSLVQRGNVIRYNYVHDFEGRNKLGAQGIYVDDSQAGDLLWGNVISNVAPNRPSGRSGGAFNIGGGRDNRIENNIVYNAKNKLFLGVWGFRDYAKNEYANTAVGSPPFSIYYPELAAVEDVNELGNPLGSTIKNNLFFMDSNWYKPYTKDYAYLVDVRGNMTDLDPGFLDPGQNDFSLRADSPIYSRGFKVIPFKEIGLLAWPRPENILLGDLSGDGKVTAYDAALASKISLRGNPTQDELKRGDVNGDGKIDGADAVLIGKRVVGL